MQKIAVQQTAQPITLTFTTSVVAQTVQTNNVTGTMWDITGNFVPGFLWGVAVAAHQVEGYNTNSDWWMFETFCNGFWEAISTCFPKFIRDSGRATYSAVTDQEALDAFRWLAEREGLIAAFESSHAVAALRKDLFAKGEHVLVNLSGRGDKDMESASRILRL